jgi:adenylate cyclase class 2
MKVEYEASFANIDKDEMRQILRKVGATLVKPEFMQKRVVFYLPEGRDNVNSFARVRDEGDKITMSIKQTVEGGKIDEQFETCFDVSDFEEAVKFLEFLGCKQKAFQETKRELWALDGAEITIDEWPFLEPFVEVEADSEEIVESISQKLNFDYSKAYFVPVGGLYSAKYGVSVDVINNKTPKIVFGEKNPFVS